jgi:DNA repair exonuclease SbcCD nuclease subunit
MKGFNRKHHKMNEPEAEVRRIFELAWPGSIAGRKLGEITEKKMAGKWDIENGARPGPASRPKKVSPPVDPTSTPDTNLAPRGKAVIFDAKNYEKTQNHAINQLKITSF